MIGPRLLIASGAALALGSVVLLAQAQSRPALKAFTPVAPLDSLMQGQQAYFHEIYDLLDHPKARGRSARLARAAELMAELANVSAYHEDRQDFRDFAIDVRDRALELAKEAKKRSRADEARMRAVFEKINDNCTACHDL